MSVIWYKVWYDLWHNKLRTLLVILSIAVGVFGLMGSLWISVIERTKEIGILRSIGAVRNIPL